MSWIEAFHFMRPLWLLALPVVVALWWWLRPRQARGRGGSDLIAPHLAQALRTGGAGQMRLHPADWAALAAVLLTLGAAGPSWSRLPNPLISETTPLVIALELTPSMQATDLPPSRLDRARFKVTDLITARGGAQTALIAYAGSAHQVAPLTSDPQILRPLLEGLSPEVMPRDGDDPAAALALAAEILNGAELGGAVLVVADEPPQTPSDLSVICLLVAPAVGTGAGCSAGMVTLTADDRDIAQITRLLRRMHAADLAGDDRLAWRDQGPWLAWPVALLILLGFRRGWALRMVLATALAAGLLPTGAARAEGWRDLFLTPDQQGMIAYNAKDYDRAATLFTDPAWRGMALLKSGQYEAAATHYAGLGTAEAAFAEGLARLRNREYRGAIAAYETALDRRPDYPEAARNLAIAQAVLIFVEDTREASDTGEERGLGADDTVYDNDAARGTETRVTEDAPPASVTTDQWLQSIDTQMGDFLKSRFQLDLARRSE